MIYIIFCVLNILLLHSFWCIIYLTTEHTTRKDGNFMINLNKDILFIGNFEYGKTQNIECRLGRKLYLIDIDKNVNTTCLHFYKKMDTDRNKHSKYDVSESYRIIVKNEALLDKNVFKNIAEIEKAQFITSQYRDVLA